MENEEISLSSVEAHLRENPQDASAWNVKGVIHAQREEFGEALRCLDQAIQIDSSLAAAHSNRGRVLLTLSPEKATEALRSFDRALQLKPDDIDILRDKAYALRAMNRPKEELAIYEKLSELAKDNAGVWLRLGDLQLETGDIKGAISSYEDAQAYVASQTSDNYRIVSVSPFSSPLPLEELKSYKLVHPSDATVPIGNINTPAVKIFEYLDFGES